MNILAIETGVLPPPDSYLDRDNNIPLEDGDQPLPPPPVETDSIWHHGSSWPYVLDTPCGNGDDDSQPPSLPPSPGLSYRTSRTPSLRSRSVTPSHHSSGRSRSRSQMLMEQVETSPCLTELSKAPISTEYESGARWERTVTMSDGTTRVRPMSPGTLHKLMGPYWSRFYSPAAENSRALACHQALESPLAPQTSAIHQLSIRVK